MLLRSTLLGASLLALSACASVPGVGGGLDPAEVGVVAQETTPDGLDPIAQAAFWGTRYDRDPSDPHAATEFSKALRAVSNNEEALRVMSQVASRAPNDAEVQLELGKALIANERAHEAVRPIERAIANGKHDDWTAYSAYGVALDKTGAHEEARVQYDRALAINPRAAGVFNNKGLSYALEGKSDLAERTLRTATAMPGGTARVRQNLALVLGLSGETEEAERLARSDLPPVVADNNAAYFRNLVAQPAYWGGLTAQNAELPTFDDEPYAPPMSRPDMTNNGPVPLTRDPAPKPAPQPEGPIKGEPAVGASLGEGQVIATAAPEVLADDGV
jgi:Flp pilus assembly protein TadD